MPLTSERPNVRKSESPICIERKFNFLLAVPTFFIIFLKSAAL